MSINFFQLFVTLVTLATISAASLGDKNEQEFVPVTSVSNQPASLKYIGSVDHKSYFAETETTMTWADAEAYCQGFNLKLASITTKSQTSFLQEALPPYGVLRYYHTNLRELTPVVDNETGEKVDLSIFKGVRRYPYDLGDRCGQFGITHSNYHQLMVTHCTDTEYPLCSI